MKKRATAAGDSHRSPCPVACALDWIGDKWSLLVIRDLFGSSKTYGELQASPEHIPTNILADRLKRLEAAELVSAEPYQQRPVRYAYSLTARGRDLKPVLVEVARWGKRHIAGTVTAPTAKRRRGAKPSSG